MTGSYEADIRMNEWNEWVTKLNKETKHSSEPK